MAFKKIYVVGAGSTAAMCVKLLKAYHADVTFFHCDWPCNSFAAAIVKDLRIPCQAINRDNVRNLLGHAENALVLSVNNRLLFPAEVVRNENLIILNYHNSLLPFHRGVHAECWTIFDGDAKTGVTWHKVDTGIDTGAILWQMEVELSGNETSLQLLKTQSDCALSLLKENVADLLAGALDFKPQVKGDQKAHLAREWPWGGIIEAEAPNGTIGNFLRAMDYGNAPGYPAPLIRIGEELYTWKSYKRLEPSGGEINGCFRIPGTDLGLFGVCKYSGTISANS